MGKFVRNWRANQTYMTNFRNQSYLKEKFVFIQVQSSIVMDTITIGGREMRVMRYYLEAIRLLKPRDLIYAAPNSTTRFIVTGHSLGGALASLFSIYAKDELKWYNPGKVVFIALRYHFLTMVYSISNRVIKSLVRHVFSTIFALNIVIFRK